MLKAIKFNDFRLCLLLSKLYLCILNNFLIYEIYSCKWRITESSYVVSGVISSSQSRPILENFLFELENEILKITASDGETTLITSLAVKSDDQGKIAVPAKIFQDLIKTFGDQPLTFSVKDSESGEGGLLEILDEKDNYEVALDNAEDYPELPEFDASQKVTLASGVLADALSNTLFATSNDSLRPVMTEFFSNLQKKKPISYLQILTD